MPFVEGAEARVWWEEHGRGAPLLLIQGLGFPSSMWYRVLPGLAEAHRVLVFDNRGVGRTGVPAGPYPVEAMAGDAARVLDAAGVDRAHVLGISLGGLIAQELALSHTERLESLILAATHPGGPDTVLPPPDVLQLLYSRNDLSPEESIRATIPVAYADTTDPALIDEDVAARLRDPTSPDGYMNQLLGGMAYPGALARLRDLTVPTLCLHGTEDRLVPPANSETLAGAIPNARLEWVPGAAHMLFTDAPERFVKAIVDFTGAVTAARP
jgi:pimeloyl-ACP methyl ester carboxylesterase